MRSLRHRVALLLVAVAPAAAFALAPAPATAASLGVTAPDLHVDQLTLANGLQLLLHEDHRTPIVTVNVWYHVGSKDEVPGRSGFAHLFEHMMFQGSKHVPEDTYMLTLQRAGATGMNGTTSEDRTNYFETVPANRLELALWLESDRMGFLLDHVDQASFDGQRKVVAQERGERYESQPYGLVDQFVREAVFPPSHPYHRVPIGSMQDLEHATVDDVKSFFRTWYVPNNATLTIAGDFDPKTAKDLVTKYFGPIPGGPAPAHVTAAMPALTGETRVDVAAGVELPRVLVDWVTPPMFAPGDAELDLLAHALAVGKTSRLYKRLVYDLQIANSVSAAQGSMQLASVFEIDAIARPGHTAEELLKVIDEELAKVRAQGIGDDELGRASTAFFAHEVFGLESDGNRANMFQEFNQIAHDPAFLPKYLQQHDVPAAAVQSACARWLPDSGRVVTVVTPTPDAPLAGKVVGTKTTRKP